MLGNLTVPLRGPPAAPRPRVGALERECGESVCLLPGQGHPSVLSRAFDVSALETREWTGLECSAPSQPPQWSRGQQAFVILLQQIHLSPPEGDFHGNRAQRELSGEAWFVQQVWQKPQER